ncbi:MAG: zf-TFIIB domain-containing protein [Chloroflexota bacterium]|nr:zf-TFIIB domain-containing protein [Chloroflexota bacterium]
MNCLIDGTTLQMADLQGIEIDDCPECRGVWLDRGELDKIIERSATSDDAREWRSDDRDRDDDRWDAGREHGKRKKRSMLEDVFAFG